MRISNQPSLVAGWLAVCLVTIGGPEEAGAATGGQIDSSDQGEFIPQNCPEISNEASIVARVTGAPSGAPATVHPGLDLWVRDSGRKFVLRIHFGDPGNGLNTCLSFNECKDVQELPGVYRVDPRLLRSLLDYLRDRDFNVGKFVSWGVPIFPWGANGSNCGDAFLVTLRRLDIADLVLPDIQRWIQDNKKGKWAFDRGLRRPADEFFQQQ